MDEVEFLRLYNDAVTAAQRITMVEDRTAMMLVLQLVADLNNRVLEIQSQPDDEEEEDESE